MGLIGFIFRNFFLLVGIGVLISVVIAIKNMDPKEAIIHKGPAFLLLGVFIVHSLLYWKITDDPDLLVYAARCIVPTIGSLFVSGVVHEVNSRPRREGIVIIITYAVCFVLSILFKNWIINAVAVVLGVLLLLPIGKVFVKQAEMDMHSQDQFGDSNRVKELYKEGYRPADFYDTGKKGKKAREDLMHHGVNPFK